jgi:alkylation response protein AidB-like acyl-CoA dehydrogenase
MWRRPLIPSRVLRTARSGHHEAPSGDASSPLSNVSRHEVGDEDSESVIHTIFEGTSEIQQLVIARAISGLRIE